MSENKIKSVAEFVAKLSELGEVEKDKMRFFRGHSNEEYFLQPSIYREPYLIESEHKIIKDAFTYCADEFLPHETLFEKLVKLQHYDYKTRLLDITSNALVALYFTCVSSEDKQGKDGEVVILDIPDKSIVYNDSDRVAILSAISLRDESFDVNSLVKNMDSYQILEILLISKDISQSQQDLNLLMKNENNKKIITECLNKIGLTADEFISQKLNSNLSEITRKFFNDNPEIIKLLNDIRKDKPYFLPNIDYCDMQKVLCVKTKHNNPRILRQHGGFLIFGIQGKKQHMAEVPKDWKQTLNGERFIIDKASKNKILKELQSFGISRQTLFPELDAQATQIIERYKK